MMAKTFKFVRVAGVFFGLILLALPSYAQQGNTSTVGVLNCDISSGVSFVFGSTRELNCVYEPNNGPVQVYTGRIEKFGVDVGFLQSGVILWQVIAPATSKVGPGSLAGTYAGASADVVAGIGVGANALVGANNWMLNPLSISGSQGLNIAAGVSSVTLRYVSSRRR